jgi:hypothetical protein
MEPTMKPSAKLVSALVWTLWSGSVGLGFVLFIGAGAFFQAANHGHPLRALANSNARESTSTLVVPQIAKLCNHENFTRYLMGFSGDRSLDVATAVEQVHTGYVRYLVRLRLSSGAEQSIAVMGPPGGLRPEVRDMTGDGVRNDLILTSALIRWPLTVLVNDGHDHFVVVSSADSPRSLGHGDDRASGTRDVQSNVALVSSRFKADYPVIGERLFLPQLQESFFSPTAQVATVRLGSTFNFGRAPPRV